MPGTTTERVDRLETAFASFMEKSEELLADIRASNARIAEMQRQADKDREAADKDRERADRDRKDFNKRMAELSDSMGTLIEDMVAPNARRIASELFPDDPVVTLAQRIRRNHPTDPGRMIEIDLLAAGREHLMIVEAKRRLNAEKIREFVESLQAVPAFFPEYASHKIVPVIASVITFLNRQKVYGVAMGDETIELVNLGQF